MEEVQISKRDAEQVQDADACSLCSHASIKTRPLRLANARFRLVTTCSSRLVRIVGVASLTTMTTYVDPSSSEKPYRDPTPLPADVPKVQELGTTSAPLKSAAFFIGAYCKDYNGELTSLEGRRG